ncbi:MAG TPA: hypothetical protein VJ953_09505 [Saprospiraceae bacterium]|nr:hypothetical protein [Saprospiraceae bacterium]
MKEENKKSAVQQELQSIAPQLAQLKEKSVKQAPDDVPPRYFRELPDDLWQRIQRGEKTTASSTPSESILALLNGWLRSPLAIGLTAIVILLIGVWVFSEVSQPNWTVQKEDQLQQLQEIPQDVLYDYLMEHISEYETADFAGFEQALPLNGLLPIDSDEAALDEMIDEYLEQAESLNINEFL